MGIDVSNAAPEIFMRQQYDGRKADVWYVPSPQHYVHGCTRGWDPVCCMNYVDILGLLFAKLHFVDRLLLLIV